MPAEQRQQQHEQKEAPEQRAAVEGQGRRCGRRGLGGRAGLILRRRLAAGGIGSVVSGGSGLAHLVNSGAAGQRGAGTGRQARRRGHAGPSAHYFRLKRASQVVPWPSFSSLPRQWVRVSEPVHSTCCGTNRLPRGQAA